MSFINEFEERIGSIFGEAPQGYTEPFSFKKLAKQAAREMDREVLVSHGVETAPALYTVLVSPTDDEIMRPFYPQITEETSAYIYAQAKLKGYAFVGTPLVRFMVDNSLRSGRFAVFAENVDAATLNRLRQEERTYLGLDSGKKQAAQAAPQPARTPQVAPMQVASDARRAAATTFDEDDLDLPLGQEVVTPGVAAVPVAAPHGAHIAATVSDLATNNDDADDNADALAAKPPTCMLIDRQSGRTYKAEAPSAIIGRERSQVDIVITDPNASRVHAQLSFDGTNWHITDRRSTNGTLVNDIDVTECILKNGDYITIGLTSLEFREM